MSHITKLDTKIKDVEAIIQAAKNLGYVVKEDSYARGYKGELTKGEIIIFLNCEYDLIVNRNFKEDGSLDGYKLEGDFFFDYIENELGKGCGKLLQEYNILVAEKEARKRGYLVSRERGEDGTVRMVLKDVSR